VRPPLKPVWQRRPGKRNKKWEKMPRLLKKNRGLKGLGNPGPAVQKYFPVKMVGKTNFQPWVKIE